MRSNSLRSNLSKSVEDNPVLVNRTIDSISISQYLISTPSNNNKHMVKYRIEGDLCAGGLQIPSLSSGDPP